MPAQFPPAGEVKYCRLFAGRKQRGRYLDLRIASHAMKKPARSRKFPAQPSARLGAYLAAGLGASTIGTAQSAIVFFDVDPAKTIGVAGDPTNQTVSFTDINIGAGTYTGSIGYGAPTVSGLSLWFTITGENQFTAQSAGGMSLSYAFNFPSSNLQRFSAGQEVGAGGFKYTSGPIAGWNGSGTGYVGLAFRDALAPADNFGWLELDYVANGASTTLTIGGFAFEDQPGVAIAAGAEVSPIPEPGTWAAAALLVGGAAFLRWRKRRDEAQKEAA
jgi:hypothetical protein